MNPDLFVWTSDWHLGRLSPSTALTVAQQIASMKPAGVIDTGDCKDAHDGTDQTAQLDAYNANVKQTIPWAAVNPGGAPAPILPGNHDELNGDTAPAPNDFTPFDGKLWGPPYHWTCDWAAPRIRFVGYHAWIVHPGAGPTLPYSGVFAVQPAERQWLRDQLDALPDGWQAIVCSHPPLLTAFGSNIGQWAWLPAYGQAEILAILADHAPRVAAYLSGHRHANMNAAVQDGITHFNGPGVSYTLQNGSGGFVPIDYDPQARTLTFRYLYARPPFAPYPGYTPVVIQLPALPTEPPAATTYPFDATTTLGGDGPLSGSAVAISGTVEVTA